MVHFADRTVVAKSIIKCAARPIIICIAINYIIDVYRNDTKVNISAIRIKIIKLQTKISYQDLDDFARAQSYAYMYNSNF